MPRFRSPDPALAGVPVTPAGVRSLLADVLRLGHFYAGPALQLQAEQHPAEDISWEIFQGRFLDPAHTRQRATLESWSIYAVQGGERSEEPLLSLKLEPDAGRVHVVR